MGELGEKPDAGLEGFPGPTPLFSAAVPGRGQTWAGLLTCFLATPPPPQPPFRATSLPRRGCLSHQPQRDPLWRPFADHQHTCLRTPPLGPPAGSRHSACQPGMAPARISACPAPQRLLKGWGQARGGGRRLSSSSKSSCCRSAWEATPEFPLLPTEPHQGGLGQVTVVTLSSLSHNSGCGFHLSPVPSPLPVSRRWEWGHQKARVTWTG